MRFQEFRISLKEQEPAADPAADAELDDRARNPNDARNQQTLTAGPPYPPEDMEAVRNMQSRLESLGYSVGSTGIDGKYGPRTARAVQAFKTDHNIPGPADQMDANNLIRLNTAAPVESPTPTGNEQETAGTTDTGGTRDSDAGTGQPVVPVDDYTPPSSVFNGPESDRASIRFNNPGAMYPASWQRRYGGTDTGARIGGGHRIAMFPDRVSGAAALFGLLNGRAYRDLTVADALRRWTGGNSSSSYINWMSSNGIDTGEVVRNYLANEDAAIGLAALMARWETGHPYPMDRTEWARAYSRAGLST